MENRWRGVPDRRQGQHVIERTPRTSILFRNRSGPTGSDGTKGVDMRENSKALLERLAQDEGLRDRMAGAASADEAYAIASEAVPGLGGDEFVEALAELGRADEDLSLDDLENVAGGTYTLNLTPFWMKQRNPDCDPDAYRWEIRSSPTYTMTYTITIA